MEAKKTLFLQILERKELLLFPVLFFAGISLIGWIFDITILKSFSYAYIPIAPSTAIMFITLCFVFLSTVYTEKLRFVQTYSIHLIFTVVLICVEIFLEHFFKFSWDIENVVLGNPELLGPLHKGHMSQLSSLLFVFTCIGIFGIRQNDSTVIKYIGSAVSTLVCLVSSILLIGYLYKAPLLYGGGQIFPVSLPTTICFLLFGITLLRVYEVKFWTFNLIKINAITSQLLNWFLPIVIFIVLIQGFLISNVSIRFQNHVLSAALILLIVVIITVFVIVRISTIIGARILNSENELTKSEEKYRSLTENIGEGIGFLDEKEKFTYANPSAEKIFGVNKGELLGLCLNDFLSLETIEIIKTETLKRSQGESSVYEIEIILKDRSKKDILVTATPRFDDKNFIGTFGIFRDIAERKRAEEELKLKNEQLVKLNAEKDKFFSIIAHDLRSPFNTFLGFTKMIADDTNSMEAEKIKNIAMMMKTSAISLSDLLENLLSWAMSQKGETIFIPTYLKLMATISKNTALIQEAANKKEIEITYNIPEDLEVFADENMLGCIIRNLCFNAVKFNPKGGKINISAKPISDTSVEISIKDKGIGMKQEILANLFKFDNNTNRKGTAGESSTGLGLILCKEFVEKHDGKIWIESEEGKGSIFSFTMPTRQN